MDGSRRPPATSIAWRSSTRMETRLSSAPRLLPGRLTINVEPRSPATPRESHEKGLLSAPRDRMASARPGAWRSSTRSVASGVRSRGLMPVPPAVRISAAPFLLHCSKLRGNSFFVVGNEGGFNSCTGPVLAEQLDNRRACGIGHQALRATVGNGKYAEEHGRIRERFRVAFHDV